jgi:uncharacterized membrane protein
MLRNSIINLVLKIALCISLLYVTLASFISPNIVVLKWPHFISDKVSEQSLAQFTGLLSITLIVWLLSGKKKFLSSITIGICVVLTILVNITVNVSFVFSILPLLFISIALALRYYPRIRVVVQTKVTPLGQVSTTEVKMEGDGQAADVTDLGIAESEVHIEHDQHIFISKQ